MSQTKEALELAIKAREKAHAPYSKFKVGSAVKFKESDKIFTGCNVENASFGGTICAERVAITKAISELGSATLELVVVVTDSDPIASPCGMCRQVISEFGIDDTLIISSNLKGQSKTYTLKELLPDRFKL